MQYLCKHCGKPQPEDFTKECPCRSIKPEQPSASPKSASPKSAPPNSVALLGYNLIQPSKPRKTTLFWTEKLKIARLTLSADRTILSLEAVVDSLISSENSTDGINVQVKINETPLKFYLTAGDTLCLRGSNNEIILYNLEQLIQLNPELQVLNHHIKEKTHENLQ